MKTNLISKSETTQLLKIVSEKYVKKQKPDYLLVLPWHFKEHILKKEKKLLDKGIKFIFPLPEIEIV